MTGSGQEFMPSAGARSAMRWAYEQGATTLGEAFDLLDLLEVSNDVPEVLGHDDTVDDVRDELAEGLELTGSDTPLDDVM